MAQIVQIPFPVITDSDGTPLDSGYVYIGTSGIDAEVNPINVYWDIGLTIPAAQPIRTLAGYFSNNGSAGNLYVSETDHSMKVKNKNSATILETLSATDFSGTIPSSIVTGQFDSDRIDHIRSELGAVTRTAEDKFNDTVNVKDFGAIGDGVTDDTVAIQAAIDALDGAHLWLTGGVIYFPRGRYLISETINVRTTIASGEYLTSITLRGDGKHNTIFFCAAGFTGADAVYLQYPNYCVIEDMSVDGNDNVTNGIHIEDGNQITLNRVNVEEVTGSCILVDRAFMIAMSQCRTKCVNGLVGFDFSGDYNTSVFMSNCYANDTLATGTGFRIHNMAYSSLISCGCDNVGYWAYHISNVNSMTMISCGAEQAGRASFYFEASAALDAASSINGVHCKLIECFSHNADNDGGGYGSIYSNQADTSSIDVVIERFNEFSVFGAVSVSTNAINLDHHLKIVDSVFTGTISGAGVTPSNSQWLESGLHNVTGASHPIFNVASFNGETSFFGTIEVMATAQAEGVYGAGTATKASIYLVHVYFDGSLEDITTISSVGYTIGASAAQPSFTFDVLGSGPRLTVTPVASTTGNFYFLARATGNIKLSTI